MHVGAVRVREAEERDGESVRRLGRRLTEQTAPWRAADEVARDGYVGELAVARSHEGRGVGRVLIEAAQDWSRARGLRRLSVDTGAFNSASRSFYTQLGFAEEDIRLSRSLEL